MPENRPLLQFRLRTLLLMATGAAVLCSLAATAPRLFGLFVVTLGLLVLTCLVVATCVIILIGITNALWWIFEKNPARADEVEEKVRG